MVFKDARAAQRTCLLHPPSNQASVFAQARIAQRKQASGIFLFPESLTKRSVFIIHPSRVPRKATMRLFGKKVRSVKKEY
jgi:hypothetical protein